MINYNDFEPWPEIIVRPPKAGGKLFTKYGDLIAYVDVHGNLQVLQDMDPIDAESWQAFGIGDPTEQRVMMDKISNMINNLKAKRNG